MRCCILAFFLMSFFSPVKADVTNNWHQWRGPEANGVSRTASPPLTWSETENVKWKVEIEGEGGSTPIIWDDKVFVLTAVDTGKVDDTKTAPGDQKHKNPFGIKYPNTYFDFVVLCLNREDGSIIWRKVATTQVPVEGHHNDNDFASSSPTTDGERLYAWFGSAGFYCFTLDGDLVWERNLGPATTRLSFGEASSPMIHDGKVCLIRDQEGQSAVYVMDAASGKTIWKKTRDEPSCWATPILVEKDGVKQLITNGHNRVRSYNLVDGAVLWECGGQVSNVTPSPVTDGTNVYCMSGYRGSSVMALPLNAKGDITGSDQVVWQQDKGTPYVPSPILYDDLLFFNQSNNAILTCIDARSGEVLIERTRMPGMQRVYASPVGAGDRVYYVGRDGTTLVIGKAKELSILATNKLDEFVDSSPALAGDEIYLRGEKYLYCLSNPKEN